MVLGVRVSAAIVVVGSEEGFQTIGVGMNDRAGEDAIDATKLEKTEVVGGVGGEEEIANRLFDSRADPMRSDTFMLQGAPKTGRQSSSSSEPTATTISSSASNSKSSKSFKSIGLVARTNRRSS